jgi:2'-5' RNA ligase
VRTFIGIALAGPLRTTLERCAEAIVLASPAWRDEKWVPTENLHVTLRFLGEVPEEGIPQIVTLLADVTSLTSCFDLTLSGVAVRPRPRAASMLWAEFSDGTAGITALAERLAFALASDGDGRPDHPFNPHVTLVRARRPRPVALDALAAAATVIEATPAPERSMSVTEVTLYSSTLTPRGSRYEALAIADCVRD